MLTVTAKRSSKDFEKKFGEELTYSTYRILRELGLQNDDIARMYKISKTTLHNFVKAHKDVLGA